MLYLKPIDPQSLRNRGLRPAFEDDPDLWETDFLCRRGDEIFAGKPRVAKELGIYFQPRAGTGGPVILLDEIDDIYEVMIVPRS